MKKLLLAVLLAAHGYAAITYDSTASTTGLSSSPVSWTHTASGSNITLMVYVMVQPTTDIVAGVTYNGVPLTRIAYSQSSSNYSSLYAYCLAGAPAGSNTIQISFTSSYWATYELSTSYAGTAASCPANHSANLGTFGANASMMLNITTTSPGSWVVGCFTNNQGFSTLPGTGTTARATGGFVAMDSNGPISSPGPAALAAFTGGTSVMNGIAIELKLHNASSGGYPTVQ